MDLIQSSQLNLDKVFQHLENTKKSNQIIVYNKPKKMLLIVNKDRIG